MTLIPAVFLVVGIGLLVAAVWMFTEQHAFYANALRADGRVVDIVSRRSSDGRRVLFAPKLVFTDTAGRPVTFISSVASSPADFLVGDRALVAYDRGDSSHAEVDSFSARWMGVLICGGLGTFMPLLATLIFIGFRRMK